MTASAVGRIAPRPRRVAVVGSGVAGLTAAHLLGRHGDDVTLFEADGRAGGHAHTHDVDDGGRMLRIDTGFIVHNDRTYPLLTRLFGEIGVATQDAEMSFSVRCDGCGLEYAGARGPRGVLASPRHLRHPPFLRMLAALPRFHREARRVAASESDITLREFLDRGRYRPYFVQHFVIPFVSAVWSCAPGVALDYPARYLFVFLDHHGLLAVRRSPPWRTVVGGSRDYVDRIVKTVHDVRLGTPVTRMDRLGDSVMVSAAGEPPARFDAAVVATHADQTLRLLGSPTGNERAVLGAFGYSRNHAVLHTDESVLPHSTMAQASWNYRLDSCASAVPRARVSYDLERLQRLGGRHRYIVSLNEDSIRDDRVVATVDYDHPVYTTASVAAQAALPALSDGVVAYAGAHHGWGFHEDGCRAGVAAATALGAPW